MKSKTLSTPPTTSDEVVENPWRILRAFTDARIGLGRTGVSLPTHEMLAFQLAHAQAKDAVHLPLDVQSLSIQLSSLQSQPKLFTLHSQADDRLTYLQRPDLGKRLNEISRLGLMQDSEAHDFQYDLAIVVVDGLSSKAVQQNTPKFIGTLFKDIRNAPSLTNIRIAPLCIVEQGRVAIGDEIGELLNAQLVIILIGERPGLSSPDSLGLYLTWQPKVGLNDAYRNCISNIRPAGLAFKDASQKALYLIQESRRLKLSGVNLKDRSHEKTIEHEEENKNFLIE
jgi:ethanolamine ammonia-lyase small subunit